MLGKCETVDCDGRAVTYDDYGWEFCEVCLIGYIKTLIDRIDGGPKSMVVERSDLGMCVAQGCGNQAIVFNDNGDALCEQCVCMLRGTKNSLNMGRR